MGGFALLIMRYFVTVCGPFLTNCDSTDTRPYRRGRNSVHPLRASSETRSTTNRTVLRCQCMGLDLTSPPNSELGRTLFRLRGLRFGSREFFWTARRWELDVRSWTLLDVSAAAHSMRSLHSPFLLTRGDGLDHQGHNHHYSIPSWKGPATTIDVPLTSRPNPTSQDQKISIL